MVYLCVPFLHLFDPGARTCNWPLLHHKLGFIAFVMYQTIKSTIFNDQQLQNLLKVFLVANVHISALMSIYCHLDETFSD